MNAEHERLSINHNHQQNEEDELNEAANTHLNPNSQHAALHSSPNANSVTTNSTNATTANRASSNGDLSPDQKSILFSKTELGHRQLQGTASAQSNNNSAPVDAIAADDQSCYVLHVNKDLKYISQYLPNNKCSENIDHHDHENEKEHLHRHGKKKHSAANLSLSILPEPKTTSKDFNYFPIQYIPLSQTYWPRFGKRFGKDVTT
jgi:hypothetical protein